MKARGRPLRAIAEAVRAKGFRIKPRGRGARPEGVEERVMKFAFCAACGSDWRPGLAKASQRRRWRSRSGERKPWRGAVRGIGTAPGRFQIGG
jgi:hypothetical protein